jgi:hypothetical protein
MADAGGDRFSGEVGSEQALFSSVADADTNAVHGHERYRPFAAALRAHDADPRETAGQAPTEELKFLTLQRVLRCSNLHRAVRFTPALAQLSLADAGHGGLL